MPPKAGGAVVECLPNWFLFKWPTHSKESHQMHLVWLLVIFACHYKFWLRAEHVQAGSTP